MWCIIFWQLLSVFESNSLVEDSIPEEQVVHEVPASQESGDAPASEPRLLNPVIKFLKIHNDTGYCLSPFAIAVITVIAVCHCSIPAFHYAQSDINEYQGDSDHTQNSVVLWVDN